MRYTSTADRFSLGVWLRQSTPTVLTVLWFLIGVCLYFSQTWLFQTLDIYFAVPFLVHAGWAALQALTFFILLFFGRRDVRILLLLMMASAFMFFFGIGLFRRVGDQIAFQFIRAPFDEAVIAATAPRDKPVLLAFPWTAKELRTRPPAGASITDARLPTGRAIVYDETDAINLISARTWQRASPQLGEVIGGRPERCIRFAEPHYYLCSFS